MLLRLKDEISNKKEPMSPRTYKCSTIESHETSLVDQLRPCYIEKQTKDATLRLTCVATPPQKMTRHRSIDQRFRVTSGKGRRF